MKKSFMVFILVFLCAGGFRAIGSDELVVRLSQVDLSAFPRVGAYVSVTDGHGDPVPGIKKRNFLIFEARNGEKKQAEPISVSGISDAPAPVNIILLLDTSGSMDGEKLARAKDAVTAFQRIALPRFSISLASFSTDVKNTIPITAESLALTLQQLDAGGSTQLYGAVFKKLLQLENAGGRKAVVVLSDGMDNENTEYYKTKLFDAIPSSDVSVYTIGLGYDADSVSLRAIAGESGGTYHFSPTENELKTIFEGIAVNIANEFLVTYVSPFKDYRGLKRGLSVTVTQRDKASAGSYSYIKGGFFDTGGRGNESAAVRRAGNEMLNMEALAALFAMLAVLMFILPLFKVVRFRLFYVHRYRRMKSKNVKPKIDSYTTLPFNDSTLVVTKCSHWVSVESWKRNSHKCPEYPTRCRSGVGRASYKIDFFNQQGINKYFNWLWFGALGGLGAWGFIVYTLEKIPLDALSVTLAAAISESVHLPALNSSEVLSLLRAAVTGLFVGSCLGFSLGIVEELLQGLSFHSIIRISARTIVGSIAGGFGFLMGDLLFIMYLNSDYGGRFIGWLILGGILGGGLTFYSGSEFRKGMMGGLLGAGAGFHLCHLGVTADAWHTDAGKLQGLVFLGAAIGFILSIVLSNLQEFYFECVSGPKRGMVIPAAKWLKHKNSKLVIGRAKDAHIRLYWDGAVGDYHAEVRVDPRNQVVLITPKSKKFRIAVNRKIISREARIKDGDIIKIGSTQLKYHEKRKYFKKHQ